MFFLFMLLAVHQQQNIVEQRCDIVLVPIAAQLQFLNDLAEQRLVIRQHTTVEHMLIERDAVIRQYVLYIAAYEVNPENFRVIFQIIYIFLDFFRLVKHHMARADDFFLAVKPEMRLAVCHI